MRAAAARKRANRRPLLLRKRPCTSSVVGPTVPGGTQAVKPHDLVPVGDASRVLLAVVALGEPRRGACLHRLAKLLEPRHGARRVLHLENQFDPTREGLGAPACVEDDFDNVARRVAFGKFNDATRRGCRCRSAASRTCHGGSCFEFRFGC